VQVPAPRARARPSVPGWSPTGHPARGAPSHQVRLGDVRERRRGLGRSVGVSGRLAAGGWARSIGAGLDSGLPGPGKTETVSSRVAAGILNASRGALGSSGPTAPGSRPRAQPSRP
jgi:hypothetical protein